MKITRSAARYRYWLLLAVGSLCGEFFCLVQQPLV